METRLGQGGRDGGHNEHIKLAGHLARSAVGRQGPVLGPYLILSFLGALDLDLYLPGPSFMVFSDLLDYLDDLFYGGWWELDGDQSS